MAVPYHTHTFEIPQASKADIEAGIRDDVVATPASLGSSATKDISYFATAGQGGSADTAVQSINGKTGKYITLDKADIGLSNVNNTSDLSKPISTTAQNAFDLKADKNALGTAAYQAATSFATSTQGAKADTAVQSVNGKSGTSVSVTKADVGLGNADNTSDANKPISSATQSALNGKATSAQGAKADTAIQAPGGTAGQVLTKNSSTANDASWQTVAAATAVSYGPQTLNAAQREQARVNIAAFSTSGGLVTGSFGAQSSIYVDADGNRHVWFRSADGASTQGLIYSDGVTNDIHIRSCELGTSGDYVNLSLRRDGRVTLPGVVSQDTDATTKKYVNDQDALQLTRDQASHGGFISGDVTAPYLRFGTSGTGTVVRLARIADVPDVMATIAGRGAGGVGTFALLKNASSAAIEPNDILAGSNLRWSTAAGESSSNPAGTWRAMGRCAANPSNANGASYTSLFLRTS